ncbi:MAG: LysR family substrate-binding domain-containing protein [Peptococcaceae bacterium]|nr:LysR family substrate-binding domain-containing protein [Peptococcaceae bacterium]
MVPAGGNFDYIISHEDDLCLVLPKGHPMAGQPLDFSKLRNERFIIASETDSPAMYAQIMNICRARNYKPKIINRYDRVEAVLLSVSAGLGISIVPRAICKVFFSEKVEVVPIDGLDTKRVYVVAWLKDMPNAAAKHFLKVVKEQLAS